MTSADPLTEKTRDLCQSILEDPNFPDLRRRLDTFMADDAAQSSYREVSQRGGRLQQRHAAGESVSDAEFAEFEALREGLLSNEVARGFIDAQREMHRIQETVAQYVGKTLELGRMPELADFEKDECCGDNGGCGCH